MSGWLIGGPWVMPVFQREAFSGPRLGLSHSNAWGGVSSGVVVLKFQR
jgi:hypothetical protein